ncbi:MAG: peptide-methionine (S)-S-oxide reductase MsrA [Desulfomonilaceae bacterium]
MGYSGGEKKNPTYHDLGDHSESIQIDYDPTQISYEKLLEIFWASHSPTQRSWSRQYKAAVFYHNEEQKRLAMETRDREAVRRNSPIATEILSATTFYRAEGYHQKYRLRQDRELMKEFNATYPSEADFVNSTAAARVNGYLDGYGTLESLGEELEGLGLSPGASKRLTETVKNRKKVFGLF